MACRMRNKTHLLFQILAAFVFLTLCMNAIVISSVAEMVPTPSNTTMVNRCIETERQALLLIKQGFVDINGFLSSWGTPQEEDCCNWRGVECDNRTGHVTHLMLSHVSLDVTYSWYFGESVSNISHSLLKLKNLKYLDFSLNDFGGQPIPRFVGSLSNLVYLNLSCAYFGGAIPQEIGNLSMLNHLDLSHNSGLGCGNFDFGEQPIPKFVGSLSNLVYLDLSLSNFTGEIPEEIGNLSRLHHLDLSGNFGLEVGNFGWLVPLSSLTHLKLSELDTYSAPNISHSLLKLKNLEYLDLSRNNFGGQPIPKFVGSLSNLVYLDLSSANFTGNISEEIGNLSRLHHLDLSGNSGIEVGNFGWLVHLSSLKHLHLSSCNMSGNLEDILNVLPKDSVEELWLSGNKLTGSLPDITRFSRLEELDLSSNNLSGRLPHFRGMQSLKRLDLEYNKFSGGLPDFTGCSSLRELWLEENEITEWKTQSIGQLTNLTYLWLSKNSIHSTITESHLSNLSSLQSLYTSSNSLTFNFSPGWLPPFQLTELNLASSKLGPKFPNWIRNHTQIDYLNFSNCQISDTIPMWFWNILSTMTLLDLSSNKIRGHLFSKLSYFQEIDLSYNHLEGPVPLISSLSFKINISNNRFSGELFSLSAVENMSLSYFDCSNNLMFGVLPTSWVHFRYLAYLNVGHNNFSGVIPMSIGYLTSLQKLILRNNSFFGGLPDSLKNCSYLAFVDFGLNNLSGEIPAWIGEDLPQLYALILISNKFHGSVPYHICRLSKLQFLDLSINNISGNIPQCFGNLTGMIERGTIIEEHEYTYGFTGTGKKETEERYFDTALADWKGQERKYGRNFYYLTMIDLSQNELTGEIPMGLTRLLGLNGLNLSRNKFDGEVPQEIGRLKMLECLDLSRNKFSGEIPQTMSGLNFLGYLDLSYNNFSGIIPSGTQLRGFNVSVYEGNVGLCGPPLEKCPGDETIVEVQPSSDGNDYDEDEIEYKRWLYISAALGFGTTFWGVCGVLVLNRRWRHAYFLFLNNLKDQFYVIMVVRIAKLRM